VAHTTCGPRVLASVCRFRGDDLGWMHRLGASTRERRVGSSSRSALSTVVKPASTSVSPFVLATVPWVKDSEGLAVTPDAK
jgi:hypothetical protein